MKYFKSGFTWGSKKHVSEWCWCCCCCTLSSWLYLPFFSPPPLSHVIGVLPGDVFRFYSQAGRPLPQQCTAACNPTCRWTLSPRTLTGSFAEGEGEVAFRIFVYVFVFFRIRIRDAVLHRVRRARADMKADEKMIWIGSSVGVKVSPRLRLNTVCFGSAIVVKYGLFSPFLSQILCGNRTEKDRVG